MAPKTILKLKWSKYHDKRVVISSKNIRDLKNVLPRFFSASCSQSCAMLRSKMEKKINYMKKSKCSQKWSIMTICKAEVYLYHLQYLEYHGYIKLIGKFYYLLFQFFPHYLMQGFLFLLKFEITKFDFIKITFTIVVMKF